MNTFRQNTDQFGVYLNKLYLKNVRCFKGNHEINLNDGNNNPIQWTVILGNNNVGKTTILRALASLEVKVNVEKSLENKKEIEHDNIKLIKAEKYTTFQKDVLLVGSEYIIKRKYFDAPVSIRDFKGGLLNDSNLLEVLDESDFAWIDSANLSFYYMKVKGKWVKGYVEIPQIYEKLKIIGYGTSRMMNDPKSPLQDSTQGLFDNKTLLLNVEEWLKELHFASISKIDGAEKRYNQVKEVLCNGLLPDVSNIRIQTIPDKSSYETFPEFLTSNDWVRMEDLGYGYQATLAWVADLAKRMFDTFPDLPNPLHGSSLVLVDEIDLHLHPEW